MTAIATTSRPRPLLGPLWPVTLLGPGLVLWWLLGLAPVVRPLVALPMAAHLLVRREARLPRGIGLWFGFVVLVLLSGAQLLPSDLPGFGLRTGEYVAATLILLHVHAVRWTPTRSHELRRLLFLAWACLVVLGCAALLLPTLEVPSLAQALLPRQLVADPWVRAITTPALAQVQEFLGFPLPRPAAPYAYTNGWGGAFALLLPFAIATVVVGTRRERLWARVLLAASLVPAIVSVNRTMWGSAAVALLFLAHASPDRATRRVLRRAVLLVVAALAVLLLTQLGDVAGQRLETPHSNNARLDLAEEAGIRILDRPLLGHGAPQEFQGAGTRPPVGTQGQLWSLAISHGLPATLLFCLFLVQAFRRVGPSGLGLWTRASLLAAAIQLPFYGMMGGQLFLLMAAVAGALAEAEASPRAGAGAAP